MTEPQLTGPGAATARGAAPGPARRPSRSGQAVAVLGVLAVAALAIAIIVVRAQHAGSAARRPAARPRPAAAAPQPAASPLRLAAGSGLVNGIYTKYPHTTAGAVSAATEFVTELGSTLEPDRAATIARLIADPSYTGAAQDAAQGTFSTRRQLGLSVTGSLRPGTAVALVPVMFQLRDVSTGRVTVLLLFDYTEIIPSAVRVHLGVIGAEVSWTAAGWRLLPSADGDLSGLVAVPGTAGAARKGWKAMTDGV
jgi:hypothetical protein